MSKQRTVGYDIRPCSLGEVHDLCVRFHGYGGAGGSATYAFGVYEEGRIVAAYAWQPPPPGSAKSVCPEVPQGVLSLSRMVAVPRAERHLNHISRPLRHQMKRLIDRTRWPVLVTYSDEGQGHTGHVYLCSGWKSTTRKKVPVYEDGSGVRTSSYSNGKTSTKGLVRKGSTWIQRWEHWASATPAAWMAENGWRRVPIPGRFWRSGAQAHTWRKLEQGEVCE